MNLRTITLLTGISLVTVTPNNSVAQGVDEHRADVEVRYDSRSELGRGVIHAELSNGMTVLVQENHAAPVATVRCFVRNTGSVYEGRFLGMGISHMLEHLVALGSTEKHPEEEIQQMLDSMGGQTNAFTSNDLTGYYVNCPASRTDLAIELLADSMQHSLIPEDEFRREMEVVQRELEMGLANRGRVLYQATKSLIYVEHPMRLPIIGFLPVVQSATRQDVIAFYRNRYVPQNMVFVVVGDIDADHVLEKVRDNFKSFHRTTERGTVLPTEPPQASPRSSHITMAGRSTNFSVAWPTIQLQDADLYPLDVASYILSSGNSSRLGYRLRIKEPLALGVSSSSYTPGFVPGWFSVTLQCVPENLEPCRKIVMEEIERLQTDLVSEDELKKVKRQKTAEHVFGMQTVQQQADALGRSFIATGDPMFDDRYVEGIQQVTAEQIRDVARKYFLAERMNTVVIDPPDVERQSVSEVAEFAESEVLRKQLDNGLTVLIKRTGVTPTISIQAFVKGGVLSDSAETSGRAALATKLMSRGTNKYDALAIAEYFDSIGGSLQTSSQRNTSFLQCAILKEDLPDALDRVFQVLFEPTFPDGEFNNLQRQQLAQIAAREDNPQTKSIDFWMTLLPEESPYRLPVQGTIETVSQLTAADCKEFHKQYFVPNNMVLAIFGDLDPEEMLAKIEQQFGGLPKDDGFEFPEFADVDVGVKEVKGKLELQIPDTAMALTGYATVSAYDQSARAALEVFDSILTGRSGAGGRLFNELRGEGLVYYVFAIEMTGMAPGYFVFMAQTRPETVDEVVQRIRANVQKVANEGVPTDEFELAKQKLIAAHAQRSTTPTAQAFQAAVDELYGLGYDHDRTYDERIERVTVEDVRKIVKQYFHDPIIATATPSSE